MEVVYRVCGLKFKYCFWDVVWILIDIENIRIIFFMYVIKFNVFCGDDNIWMISILDRY